MLNTSSCATRLCHAVRGRVTRSLYAARSRFFRLGREANCSCVHCRAMSAWGALAQQRFDG